MTPPDVVDALDALGVVDATDATDATIAVGPRQAASPWIDAMAAALLFAVDPAGLAGVVVRARPGPARERWLALLRALLPSGAPWRRVPLHIPDGRLLGGLDLAATLAAGRPVAERGLLAEADGGLVLLPMAERLDAAVAARVAGVLDAGEVRLERDGFALRQATRFALVALDEGAEPEERPPAVLADRLAFLLDLNAVALAELVEPDFAPAEVGAARARLADVRTGDEIRAALCAAAAELGVRSLRASILALRAARAAAALAGRNAVSSADAALAGRLVLAPRATRLPAPPDQPEAAEQHAAETDAEADGQTDGEADRPERDPETADLGDRPLEDLVLAAAAASIPRELLDRLGSGATGGGAPAGGARAGPVQPAKLRGRPIGARRGDPRTGQRLNVIETLRSAAPWQALRRAAAGPASPGGDGARRIEVRRDDFRVTRYKRRSETVVLFVVDASGSTALNRLAEAKGAVELLLAECYVRRDQVALLAFRGRGAEILLPPTRSLARAKRSLAGLPGGGPTPLAAGLDAAGALAQAMRRKGRVPIVVLLTDGGANVARDGVAGRARARDDALAAARGLRSGGVAAVVIDTSPTQRPQAHELAQEMGAPYLAMPHANAASVSRAVRGQLADARSGA